MSSFTLHLGPSDESHTTVPQHDPTNLTETLLVSISSTSCLITGQQCGTLGEHSSGKLPIGESFKYEEGEIVYYKVDHHPMLIEKQVVKKGTKYYKVIFKNKDGELMENEISEEELLSSPSANRAKI